mmetsp:Transcript_23804/g.23491  ORF Transcript_23804/g.23491 Transcript_23804/m.23491 type:complete len:124 (+) Transcript_23804:337-708(+)
MSKEKMYFGPEIALEKECTMKDVKVYQDYSVSLLQTDISLGTALSNDKFMKIQLLERADGLKWFCWTVQGRVGNLKVPERSKEFLNRTDAKAEFEKLFFKKTGNKWMEKDMFKAKPGLFTMVN